MSLSYKTRLAAVSFIAMLTMVSCMEDALENSPGIGGENGDVSAKVINSPADAQEGQLLLFLDDDAVQMLEAGQSIDVQTPSEMEVKSFSPVFKITGHNEEFARKHQLHRWYRISFDGMSLDAAAARMAQFGCVTRVQYDRKVEYGSDTRATLIEESAEDSGDGLVFNDPELKNQWHHINTGDKGVASTAEAGADIAVKDVWEKLQVGGDPEIIVAIMDGPVMYTHEDLKANMWVNAAEYDESGKGDNIDNDGNGYVDDFYGWNFERDTCKIDWTADNESGHGTHVAGIVAAVNNNGTGVCGVAGGIAKKSRYLGIGEGDGVRLMSCQIMNGGRSTNGSAAAEAFVYAADNGAHIAQCSFGYINADFKTDYEYFYNYSVEYFAIQYFLDEERFAKMEQKMGRTSVISGPLVVFASGNDGLPQTSYPGALMDCICVTGIGPDGYPAYYTNFGPGSNIAAPGGDYYLNTATGKSDILSTYISTEKNGKGEYAYMGGTSMACPNVSGVAALGLSYAKKLGKKFDRKDFTSRLLTSVNNLDDKLSSGYKFMGYSASTGTELPPRALTAYQYNMGTGSVDAWKFMMSLEGTPCLCVKIGEEGRYDLTDFFGGSAENLTYTNVEISQTDMRTLGMTRKPAVKFGKLVLNPGKAGSIKIKITAIAGGKDVAGNMSGDWTGNGNIVTIPTPPEEDEDGNETGGETGGMYITREISIVARGVASKNGGWL